MNHSPSYALPKGLAAAADTAAKSIERALTKRPLANRSMRIGTRDGEHIVADVFLPDEGPTVAKLLIASAMGVSRRFYAAFARDLASHGIAVMTFDYRGIGDSLHGALEASTATLSAWGEQDLAAATRELERLEITGDAAHDDRLPLLFVGHSVGGQVFGLVSDAPFRAALLVGSQAGYWKHWGGAKRLAMAGLWFGAVPLFTAWLGYLPMKALGQGEDIPKGVAREWARWGRDASYVGVRIRDRAAEAEKASRTSTLGYAAWEGKLRAVSIADDGYAPQPAVEALVKLYAKADTEVVTVSPRSVGTKSVGHFGWFRSHFRATLWAEARRWLLASAGVDPSGSGPA